MSSISDYRGEIERIDQKLIALFEKRMTVSGKVAAWKKTRDLPVKDEKREAELYRKWKNMLHNPEFEPYLHTIFSSLMGVSCAYQQTLLKEDVKKVAVYMGVPGSNGEAAALSQFSMDQIVGVDSFEGVIEAVHSGAVEFGFLPIENSTTGSVTDVYDLLVTSNVSIVGETYVNVCHALLGVKGAKIEDVCEVYSHAQGFSQCKEFLSLHPEWLKIPYYNTAIAARLVGEAGDKRKAAIASPRAAEIYNLDVLNPCVNTGRGGKQG